SDRQPRLPGTLAAPPCGASVTGRSQGAARGRVPGVGAPRHARRAKLLTRKSPSHLQGLQNTNSESREAGGGGRGSAPGRGRRGGGPGRRGPERRSRAAPPRPSPPRPGVAVPSPHPPPAAPSSQLPAPSAALPRRRRRRRTASCPSREHMAKMSSPTETERCIESLIAVFQKFAGKEGNNCTLSKTEFLTFMNTELAAFTKNQKDPGVLDRMMKKLDLNSDGELKYRLLFAPGFYFTSKYEFIWEQHRITNCNKQT
uniref:S100 calcium binding protein A11 n=1 Tax=Canis lupus familiaris TaxID=9615 RepID=A0A8I3PUW7_CANLF